MHVVAVASGELDTRPDRQQRLRDRIEAAELVIAVDGGLRHLAALGVHPELIVGDLDSATGDHVAIADAAGSQVHSFATEKDETDLELALLLALDRGASSINVLGLFGGRVDHELANVGLVAAPRWHDAGVLVWSDDGDRSLWVVHDRVDLDLEPGTTLSLLAWGGDAVGVAATGVRWLLDEAVLPAGSPRGVSNVATGDTQTVSVDRGVVLVVVDRTAT